MYRKNTRINKNVLVLFVGRFYWKNNNNNTQTLNNRKQRHLIIFELRFGESDHLVTHCNNAEIGCGPLQFYRTHRVYFSVLRDSGLPTTPGTLQVVTAHGDE